MLRIARSALFFSICIGNILPLSKGSAQDVAADKHVADRYTVTVLPALGEFGSYGTALNDRGQVVGVSSILDQDQNEIIHAFYWDGKKIQDIASPTWAFSWPWGVNNRGEIVGEYQFANGNTNSFLWDRGRIEDIATATNAVAYAINDSDSVVGFVYNSTERQDQAFLWRDDVFWHKGIMKFLPVPSGFTYSSANAINDSGDIVGSVQVSSTRTDAALWRNGKLYDLGVPGEADAVNDRDRIILNQQLIWQNGVLHSLAQLPNSSGTTPLVVYSINDLGQIVGRNNVCGTSTCSLRPVLWEWYGANPTDLTPFISSFIPAAFQPFVPGPMAINNRGQILITIGSKYNGLTLLLTPRRTR